MPTPQRWSHNTTHKVIDMMEEQKNITNLGGTMRLGAYDCDLRKGSRFMKHTAKSISKSVTAIVLNSTMSIKNNLRLPE